MTTTVARPAQIPQKYKICILGDEAVGKTSIISRFMYDKFASDYKITIGIDFVSKVSWLRYAASKLPRRHRQCT